MEHHADRGIYPPVHVQVALGTEDLTVKVKSLFIVLHFLFAKSGK